MSSVPAAARAALAAFAALTSPVLAQDGIRIVQVPAQLALPAPAGSNLLLEVEVQGAPRSVWLAAGPNEEARAALAPAGGGRWQLNLADPQVGRVARTAKTAALRVFAETDGKNLQSAAIAFARAAIAPAAWRCLVRTAKTATPAAVAPDVPRWFAPAQVERIEVEGDAPDTAIVAHMGATDCPLARDAGRWTLTLDEGKRQAWHAAGRLELVAQRGADTAACFQLDAVPARLDVPDGVAKFVVVQRRSATVPGTRDYLRVELDDITGGRVLLTVQGADGKVLAEQQSVGRRDRVAFALPEAEFVLVVHEMHNLLIGDDWAELHVVSRAHFEQDRIQALLHRIAGSTVTFLRDNSEHTGAATAALLRQKLTALGKPTLDEILEQIASRSGTTGNAYQVRIADGMTVGALAWLRQELMKMDAEEKVGKPAAKAGGAGK